jgi:hypothetical protein
MVMVMVIKGLGLRKDYDTLSKRTRKRCRLCPTYYYNKQSKEHNTDFQKLHKHRSSLVYSGPSVVPSLRLVWSCTLDLL